MILISYDAYSEDERKMIFLHFNFDNDDKGNKVTRSPENLIQRK